MEYLPLDIDEAKKVIECCYGDCSCDECPLHLMDMPCNTDLLPILYEYIRCLENENTEFRKKIEQGTLIELPCKVGDTVYCVYSPPYPANPNDKGKWFMGKYEVAGFYYGVKGLSIKIHCYGNVNKKELGKTVFFTREEAEKRLKELQDA